VARIEQTVSSFHKLSTLPSFSGSPLMIGEKVVGFHTGANPSLAYNKATVPFWISTNTQLETPNNVKNLTYVDELPEGPFTDFTYSTGKYSYKIRRVGRMAKFVEISKEDTDVNWTTEDDIEEFFYESVFSQVKPLDFHKPSLQPSRPFMTMLKLSGKKTPKEVLRRESGLNTKVMSADKGLLGKRKVLPKRFLKQGDSTLRLQSGVIQIDQQTQNDDLCSSKPRDIIVKMVIMTRKQDKLYNSITHTRQFQKFFRNGTDVVKSQLRRSLLAYIMSPAPLTGNPVQDFLGQHCPMTTQVSCPPIGDKLPDAC